MTAPTRREARREVQPRRRSAPVRMLLGAAGVSGAVIMGIVAGGGTFAVWNVAAPVASAATVKAGSSAITATPLQLAASALYPGRTIYATSSIRNTGTTPLSISLDAVTGPAVATPFSSALTVSVAVTNSAADCVAGKVTAAANAGAGTTMKAVLAPSVAPGSAALVCVGIGLSPDAPAAAAGGATTALTLLISGAQVRG